MNTFKLIKVIKYNMRKIWNTPSQSNSFLTWKPRKEQTLCSDSFKPQTSSSCRYLTFYSQFLDNFLENTPVHHKIKNMVFFRENIFLQIVANFIWKCQSIERRFGFLMFAKASTFCIRYGESVRQICSWKLVYSEAHNKTIAHRVLPITPSFCHE